MNTWCNNNNIDYDILIIDLSLFEQVTLMYLDII